jgi:hypothetical protein
MGSYKEHQNLVKKFKLQAQKAFPKMRFFDQHVGTFYTKNGRPVKIGTKGMPDVFALYPKNNELIYISLEFKTGKARLSLDQLRWKKMVTGHNGAYIVVRNVDEAIQELKDFLTKH